MCWASREAREGGRECVSAEGAAVQHGSGGCSSRGRAPRRSQLTASRGSRRAGSTVAAAAETASVASAVAIYRVLGGRELPRVIFANVALSSVPLCH